MANRNNRTRRNSRNNRNKRNHRGGAVCVPGTVFASQAAAMKSGCMWTNDAGVFKVAEPLMKNNNGYSRRNRNRNNRRTRNRRSRNSRR